MQERPDRASAAAADRPRHPRIRRRWVAPVAVLAALAAVFALRVPILVATARLTEVRPPPMRSDVIFLLSGDATTAGRADHAARLYHRGFAPLIVVARAADPPAAHRGLYPNDSDVNVALLRQMGVPASAIAMLIVPGGVTSTREEGRLLGWYVRNSEVSRVTIVTSEYHTGRSRWAIGRETRGTGVDLRISGARDPRFHAGDWWRSEAGLLAYFEEYVKWGANLLGG